MDEVFGFSGALRGMENASLLAIGGFALVALVLTSVRAMVTESGRGKRWTAKRAMPEPEAVPVAETPPPTEHVDEVAPGLIGLRDRIVDAGVSNGDQE
jgi:hypothetical protein